MTARFILSLDCEGKWGSADILTAHHRRDLSDRKLAAAYRAILDLLDEYGIAATFAFAGLFSQSAKAFADLRPELERFSRFAPEYVQPALNDIDQTHGSGWHGHDLVEAVTNARSNHEVALHGVTHVPWTRLNRDAAKAELHLFERLSGPVRQSRTFVYPRNLVAHTQLLADHGFQGFRTARASRSRTASLLSEFNLFERPDALSPGTGIVAIPSGYFLNWRSGLRRVVPPVVTKLRARHLLDQARDGGVVHYWLHPENVATAPTTIGLLQMLLREVAVRRDAGRCDVMTQIDYCRSLQQPNAVQE